MASDDNEESLKKILDVDSLVHHPTRLAILIFLLPRAQATFPEVLNALQLTSGNLSSHMQKLEQSQLIIIEKKFVNAKPTTILSITNIGKNAVTDYADTLRGALGQID